MGGSCGAMKVCHWALPSGKDLLFVQLGGVQLADSS